MQNKIDFVISYLLAQSLGTNLSLKTLEVLNKDFF